jgi:hypothetical protein
MFTKENSLEEHKKRLEIRSWVGTRMSEFTGAYIAGILLLPLFDVVDPGTEAKYLTPLMLIAIFAIGALEKIEQGRVFDAEELEVNNILT